MKEELRAAEFEKKFYHCELEEGTILGEEEKRLSESLMNTLKSSYLPLIGLSEKPTGEENSYVFKYNELCDFVGKE